MPLNLKIFNADRPPRWEDVQALKEFLYSERAADELMLHKLLERHPTLVGVLGFSEFVSEFPLYKRGGGDRSLLFDARHRDRADFIAATESPILPTFGQRRYKSAHIIELKSANSRISDRDHGSRLSDATDYALGQLRDYKEWLTTVPRNRDRLDAIGWDVRVPMLYLVMGTTSEFQDRPAHLDEIRGRIQERGVSLFTVDDLLRLADQLVSEKRLAVNIVRWAIASTLKKESTSSALITEVEGVAEELAQWGPLSLQPHYLRPAEYSSFYDMISNHSTVEQRSKVEASLLSLSTESAIGHHFAANVFAETRLPREAWAALIGVLSSDFDRMYDKLRDFFHSYIMAGPVIDIPSSTVCLTIKPYDLLVDNLLSQGVFDSAMLARYFLDQVVADPAGLPRNFKGLRLTRYSQWCTFNPTGGRPFEGEPQTSEYFLSALGWNSRMTGWKMLGFYYLPPKGCVLHYPTICDAGLSLEFRPAPYFSPYGLSVPWSSNWATQPRPEAIHRPVSFGDISEVRVLS